MTAAWLMNIHEKIDWYQLTMTNIGAKMAAGQTIGRICWDNKFVFPLSVFTYCTSSFPFEMASGEVSMWCLNSRFQCIVSIQGSIVMPQFKVPFWWLHLRLHCAESIQGSILMAPFKVPLWCLHSRFHWDVSIQGPIVMNHFKIRYQYQREMWVCLSLYFSDRLY